MVLMCLIGDLRSPRGKESDSVFFFFLNILGLFTSQPHLVISLVGQPVSKSSQSVCCVPARGAGF